MSTLTNFSIPKVELKQPRFTHHERQIAQIIAYPIALLLMIAFYLLKLLTKLLYKARRWIVRASIFTLVFFVAGSNLTLSVTAPKAQAALDGKYIVESSVAGQSAKLSNEEKIIYSYPHADIIDRIWNNETSKGKATDPTGINVKCAKRGLTNEFGFDPQDNYCFTTFTVAVARVNAWFDTCLSNHTLAACLETYSGNSKAYLSSFINQ